MSINVTVSGNPINIRKGKAIATSPSCSKKEYERRRLIRLSQVRQQSKNIAEEVRNKVRNQKLKQVEEIEKQGQKKLKQWQARKLLELQTQYEDAMKDMGTAHKEAAEIEKNDIEAAKKKENDDKIAKQRGAEALRKLREEVNSQKKQTRTMEVSKQSAGEIKRINRTSPEHPVSSSSSEETNCGSILKEITDEATQTLNTVREEPQEEVTQPLDVESDEQLLKRLLEERNTRISDRIRSRQILSTETDTVPKCNVNVSENCSKNVVFPSVQQNIYACPCNSRQLTITKTEESFVNPVPHSRRQDISDINQLKCVDLTDEEISNCKQSKKKFTEIPLKPKVTLRSVNQLSSQESARGARAKDVQPRPMSSVERITDKDLIISPDSSSDDHFQEKMRRRDREALERGRKALEREKLQREYEDLMKQLPALQKLERLYEMNQDKPEYHMTEERLREKERKKQDALENSFEKLFPGRRASVVTIPKQRQKSKENVPTLNVISCKEGKRLYTEEEVEALLREGKTSSNSKIKIEQLKTVLDKLKQQKEELIKEIRNLPEENEGLSEVLEMAMSNDKLTGKIKKTTSKTNSVGTSPPSRTSTKKKKDMFISRGVQVEPCEKSPQRLPKRRRPELLLSSEQSSSEMDISRKTNEGATSPPIRHCHKKSKQIDVEKPVGSSNDTDKLCQIVINIKDAKQSEVLIKESDTSKQVRRVVPAKSLTALQKSMKDDCCQDGLSRASWHERFSQTNWQYSTSSTSYFSPPKPAKTAEPTYHHELLGKKPQQSNMNHIKSSPPTKLPATNSKLLQDVKKLLNMSRLSVDELGVSSVSTVTTPSQSIIDIESNRIPPRINDTSTPLSNVSFCQTQNISQEEMPDFSFITKSSDSKAQKCPDVLTKYTKIADECSQKISNLTAMIEKVREEKTKMMQGSSLLSTTDSSTKYMDLPSPKHPQKVIENNSKIIPEDDKRLLDIDLSLAEKLKSLSPDDIKRLNKTQNDLEEELTQRLKALKEPPKQPSNTDDLDFIPLLNIPKMPPLVTTTSSSKPKRPPPSKGFLAARKLTDDYAIPHELSTIPELDSQTKIESFIRGQSNTSNSSNNTSAEEEKHELIKIESMLKSIGMDWAIPTLRKTQESLALTSSNSSIDSKSPNKSKTKYVQKISSSTLKSNASPESLQGTDELSGIQDIDFSKKYTSTPMDRSVESQRSQEKNSDAPSTIESEKGSRKFHSFPDASF